MSILVVGSVALDTVETPFGKAENKPGGSATFFSIAASHFDKVNIVGVVGDDFPFEDISFLRERGVNFEGLVQKPGKTFRWGGKYSENLNERETLFTELNVFEEFDPILPESYREIPYVFLANIHPELQLKVLSQTIDPKLVIMDTMNFWIEGTPELLKAVLPKIDILIINDSETKLLSQEDNLFRGAKKIQEMGPKTIIIKKGEHGALLLHEHEIFFAPAYPLETVIDPTGAGDSFAGGFVGYLAKTDNIAPANLKKAVLYGSVLGAFCVENFSFKRLKDITAQDIEDRYQALLQMLRVD